MSKDFASWLKKELFDRRMTAGELAGKAKISRAAAYFYVNGSRTPRAETILKIVAALGLSREQVPTFNSQVEQQTTASVSSADAAV